MTEYRDTLTDEPYNPEDLKIEVLSSAAGYYIGQSEPCGAPFSRLSGYYKKREDAEKELKEGWEFREAIENRQLKHKLEKAGKLKEG